MSFHTSPCPNCGRLYLLDEDPTGFIRIVDVGDVTVTSCTDCETDFDVKNGVIVEATQ